MNPVWFLTPMLLIRGCPEDKLESAVWILRECEPPTTATGFVAQVDEAIKYVTAPYEDPF